MNQQIDMKLSAGSWIYIAGLLGLCGGTVGSVLSAAWWLIHGEWVTALASLVVGPIFGLLTFAAYGAIGYVLYDWISRNYPNSRVVKGFFIPIGGAGQPNN